MTLEEIVNNLKSAGQDYGQLFNNNPRMDNFASVLQQGLGQLIPSNADFKSPEAMRDWGTAAALNAPMGLTAKLNSQLEKAKSNLSNIVPQSELATRYPATVPPVLTFDKVKGKEYLAKDNSPEALAVADVRKASQQNINAGNYDPYFNVEQRSYVNSSEYPLSKQTINEILPKKSETIEKYRSLAEDPSAIDRLKAAYNNAKSDSLAHDWYAMGQLESAYRKELGDEAGKQAYKTDFADAMAATTGGADPTANLLMAHYGNYLHNAKKPVPNNSYEMPYPIGGRYASGNMSMHDKVIMQNNGLGMGNPKRHNFSANFLGHKDVSTIDEQMSKLFHPKLMAPAPNAYGVYEKTIADLAKEMGVTPVNFQEVAWAGGKGVGGKPMMQHVNEMIERTHQVTGLPKSDILKGYIRKNMPMYGAGGMAFGLTNPSDQKPSN